MTINNLINKYKETSDLNRFLIKGGILFMLWRVFRKWMFLKGQFTDFTQIASVVYLNIVRFFLDILGYDTSINFSERKLWITGAANAIEIIYDCLGLNLFFIFMIFILAYPGSYKIKMWFIPAGLIDIFLLNSMRMAALTPIVANKPHLMDLYHHFIFQGVIYLYIFGMWWLFTKIASKKSV